MHAGTGRGRSATRRRLRSWGANAKARQQLSRRDAKGECEALDGIDAHRHHITGLDTLHRPEAKPRDSSDL